MDTINKNIGTDLINVNKEVGLEVNIEKTHHQNAGQNHDIKITNILFENVSQFKYLGTTVTNQNLNHEEIKKILNTSNA
jgi:hypothetical protein